MADPPTETDQTGRLQRRPLGKNRRDRRDGIAVQGMPKPQQEAQTEECQERWFDHEMIQLRSPRNGCLGNRGPTVFSVTPLRPKSARASRKRGHHVGLVSETSGRPSEK